MITILLKVAEIRKETEDTITLCLKQPGLKKVKYLAGQYLTLIFRINGRRYIRPYSFSSAPGIDSYLEVTVKRVPHGIVSNHINDEVSVNDMVEVMMPILGDFIFNENLYHSDIHIVLWGVGSGITPLISIAKYVLELKDELKVILVYGNRNHETSIFNSQIKDLQKKYQSRFLVWHFHTRIIVTEEDPFVIQGRISPSKVLKVMQQNEKIPDKSIHYICGPVGLKESVKQELFEIGIPEKNIFSEDFELVKDPKEFSNIITRQVKISFEGKLNEIEVTKGTSILESGLDASIELPYSCQTGNCIVCRGKIISGVVKMIGPSKRPDKLLDNECLLCCSYPISNDVEIHI